MLGPSALLDDGTTTNIAISTTRARKQGVDGQIRTSEILNVRWWFPRMNTTWPCMGSFDYVSINILADVKEFPFTILSAKPLTLPHKFSTLIKFELDQAEGGSLNTSTHTSLEGDQASKLHLLTPE